MWNKLATYTRKYPVKISGYISAIILYVNKHFPNLPIDIIVPSVMIIIGLGEVAQNAENKKTIEALYSDNPAEMPDSDIINHICYNKGRYKGDKDGKSN